MIAAPQAASARRVEEVQTRESSAYFVDPEGTLGADEGASARLQTRGRVGRFTVLNRLGEGGMGVVFTAYDEKLDRKVAIKLIRSDGHDEAARLRLLREAQGLARLSHPNVVQVYDTGEHLRSVFLAMEFIPGVDLQTWMRRREGRARPWRERLAVLIQAGRGLEAAHRAGLVHRDFKPGNTILGDDGRVRVLDFGLVREMHSGAGLEALAPCAAEPDAEDDEDDEHTLDTLGAETQHEPVIAPSRALQQTLTRTGAIMGTPAYMAPEQHAGRPCDALADQFSYCVTVYEALYGERPFPGETRGELSRRVHAGELRPAPADSEIPARVREVLARGLAADPGARWRDMSELLTALERASTERPRRAWPWVGGVGLAVAAVAGALALSSRASEPAADEPAAVHENVPMGMYDAVADFDPARQGVHGWRYLYDAEGRGEYTELEVGLNNWGLTTWRDPRCREAAFFEDAGSPGVVLAHPAHVDGCAGWTTLAWEAPQDGEYALSLSAREHSHCESAGVDLELRDSDHELLWSHYDTEPEVDYTFRDTRPLKAGARVYLRVGKGPGGSWCDATALSFTITSVT